MRSILRFTAVIGVPISMLFGFAMMGGSIIYLLPFAEFIVIFGMTFFALFATYGRNVFKFIIRGLGAPFSKQVSNPEFVKYASVGCHYARASTVISLALGLIAIIAIYSKSGSFAKLELCVASALCSITYGVFLSEFFFGYLRNIFSKE